MHRASSNNWPRRNGTILVNWLAGFDCPASSYVHLSWHLALFELALGQYQRAIERYEQDIRPYVVAKSMATLPDSASFLWRVQDIQWLTSVAPCRSALG